MPLFERYIGIDYSGAEVPTSSLKGLRVYVATPVSSPEEIQPPPSPRKYWTRREVAEWLGEELAGSVRTLVGVDHGFSFPLAYFQKYRLSHNWPAFLDDFQKHWPTDGDHLYVDFIRDGSHGNGAARVGSRKWRRLTEIKAGAKSVFHFDVQGQVAKSTHAGLPWLKYLRNRLGARVHFWPFDGWSPPIDRSVIAEVYPRLWKGLFPLAGATGDQEDAYSVAAWMRREDEAGMLERHFKPDLSDEDRRVAEIEGWILGLDGPGPEESRKRTKKRRDGPKKDSRSHADRQHCAECHIRFDSAGVAWVDETGVRVADVIQVWAARGQDPVATRATFPGLSMGQIYAALAYHYDHVDPS